MSFWDRGARERKRLEEEARVEEHIRARVASEVNAMKNGVVMSARQAVSTQLSGIGGSVRTHFKDVTRKAVLSFSALINTWREEQVQMHLDALSADVEKRAKEAGKRVAGDLVRQHADGYRRTLVQTIGTQADRAFTDALNARLPEFSELFARRVNEISTMTTSGETVLPIGTRFFFRNQATGDTVYVVEQPPAVRTVYFNDSKYKLAFPFVVFFVTLDRNGRWKSLKVYFRTEPLRSVDDPLYHGSLPNMDRHEELCFRPNLTANALAVVDQVVQTYWGAGFNDGSSGMWGKVAENNPQLRTFKTWQKATKRNPKFILRLQFPRALRPSVAKQAAFLLNAQEGTTTNVAPALNAFVTDVRKRMVQGAKEIALDLIPQWNLEDIPATILTEEFKKLWSMDPALIRRTVEEVAKKLFINSPDLADIEVLGQKFEEAIAREVEKRLLTLESSI